MDYAASLNRSPDWKQATDAVCADVFAQLEGRDADLSFLFVSHAFADNFDQIAAAVQEGTHAKVLLGCSGETIVGGGSEVESGPALSLWSAVMPGTEIEPFQLDFSQTKDGVVCAGLPEVPAEQKEEMRAVFLLAEPYSSVPNSVLERLADDLPGVPVMGGMASGGHGPNTNRLFFGGRCRPHGAVGAYLRGGTQVRSVVSQGCRPVGKTFIVTKADENVVHQLGGAPTLQKLNAMMPELPDEDVRLIRQGLHLGIAMTEQKTVFERGDFLVSNVIGADQNSGSLAIGNSVRVGQTVQFHVRDAQSADEDLCMLLDQEQQSRADVAPRAALLFSCNGRGTRLFPDPDHDAGTIRSKMGEIPVAGFFAQGEIGPVGGKNYVHGFTASVALFD